jgi:predicted transcriptional regulator
MTKAPEVTEIESLANAKGVEMGTALARAGVATSTYWRWKEGRTDPQSKTLRRIKAAISDLSAA